MNLFLRLLLLSILSRFRSRISLFDECATPFRVAPTDLDVLRHVNNGVYFSLQDLARTDFIIRAGFAALLKRNGWYPVIVAETLRFRKSLELFDAFEIRTKILAWDDKTFFLEHRFFRGPEMVAQGFVRARFLKKEGGTVAPATLLDAVGHGGTTSPPMPESLHQWAASEIVQT